MIRTRVLMNSFLKSEFVTEIIIVAMSAGISLIIILPVVIASLLKKVFS